MKVVSTYSFKGGAEFIKKKHAAELQDVLATISTLDATNCLTKISAEKTMPGQLLYSPGDMNDYMKEALHLKGWTAKASGKKRAFAEPRHAFGNGRHRLNGKEREGAKHRQEFFSKNKKEAMASFRFRKYDGSKPGPK